MSKETIGEVAYYGFHTGSPIRFECLDQATRLRWERAAEVVLEHAEGRPSGARPLPAVLFHATKALAAIAVTTYEQGTKVTAENALVELDEAVR